MTAGKHSRAKKIHSILLAVGVFFNLSALLLLWWDGFKTPYAGNDFSYSADIITAQNTYDEQTGNFFGAQYGKGEYNLQTAVSGNQTVIKSSYTSQAGAEFSLMRPINASDGEYTDKRAPGQEYIFAPRGATKETKFYFQPPDIQTPLLMSFVDEEEIDGLKTYRYRGEQAIVRPEIERQAALQPGEELDAREAFEMWVEPTSGWLIKYKDTEVFNVVASGDRHIIRPISYETGSMYPQSIEQHVAYAKSLRAKRLFLTQVGPSAFVIFIVLLASAVLIVKMKRPKMVPLAINIGVLLGVPALVLLGWATGIIPLTNFFIGSSAMNPLVAVCFMLVGLAILSRRTGHYKLTAVFGGLVGVISLLQLISSLGSDLLRLDAFLFGRDVLVSTLASRMSPYVAFALVAISVLLVGTGFRRYLPKRLVRFVVALTAMLGILGCLLAITQIGSVLAIPFLESLSFLGALMITIGAIACAQLFTRMETQSDDIRRVLVSLRWPALAALPVLVIGVFAQVQQQVTQRELNISFNDRITSIETAIKNRFALYSSHLQGARGLQVASEYVTADEWRDYNNATQAADNLPDMAPIGYAEQQGDWAIVQYVEPAAQRGLVGRDMFKDAVFRETVKTAIESGKVTMSRNVTDLVAGLETRAYIVAPVFKHNADVSSATAREQAVQGFVFGSIPLSTMVREAAAEFDTQLNFEIFIGTESGEGALLYRQNPVISEHPRLTKQSTLFINGQAITIDYYAEPGFRLSFEQEYAPSAILIVGTLFYLGMLTVGYLLYDMRRQRLRSKKDNA